MRKVTTIEIPLALINDEAIFTTWMNLYEAILNRPLFSKEEFVNESDLIHDSWWKTKKHVAATMYRLFSRYGNPR